MRNAGASQEDFPQGLKPLESRGRFFSARLQPCPFKTPTRSGVHQEPDVVVTAGFSVSRLTSELSFRLRRVLNGPETISSPSLRPETTSILVAPVIPVVTG